MFHPGYPRLPQVTHVSPRLPSFNPSYPRFTLFTLVYPKLPTFHPVYPRLPQVTYVSPCLPLFNPSYPRFTLALEALLNILFRTLMKIYKKKYIFFSFIIGSITSQAK